MDKLRNEVTMPEECHPMVPQAPSATFPTGTSKAHFSQGKLREIHRAWMAKDASTFPHMQVMAPKSESALHLRWAESAAVNVFQHHGQVLDMQLRT